MLSRVEITHHAAEQYRSRIDGSLSIADAFELLKVRAPSAAPLKEKTPAGHERWMLDEPPCVLVIKRDRDRSCLAVVVTVLAPPNALPDDDEHERIVAMQVSASRQAKPRRMRMHTRRR